MARILVTEDDDAVRMFVSRALMLDGHEVMTAEDGENALDVLIQERGEFDLLLTDIKMPIMDGIALTHAAASQYRDLTILLMTGFADQRERADGLMELVYDVVNKPFSLAEIRHVVKCALNADMPRAKVA
ncbi:MAG: MFS transporter [Kaistia sp. SCN 65-12]|uniref:response regulator n=1 Tax=Kaistia adipata TaxID=166954 RepID=UPI000410626A|nr:response regulator [Kaistia adipata]ODT14130.1 MAG: MFS transporter [Kaistia sp. SCN 65-12]